MLYADIDEIIDGTPKPMTNADRIRAMSDEELAEAFYSRCLCDYMPLHSTEHCDKYSCKECALEWLQQPAEEK